MSTEQRSIVSALTKLQEDEGWLSEASLRALAEELGQPLHRLESVSTFYTHFRRNPPAAKEVEVCRDLSCLLGGGREAADRLRVELGDEVVVREVSCIGRCDRAPAARIGPALVDTRQVDSVRSALADPEPLEAVSAGPWAAEVYADPSAHYSTLRRAVCGELTDLAKTLERSGLRGMGGAGFPTGRKWNLVAAEPASPRYVICNADESEPGTFKDRQILSDLPHLVIEGIALAAHAVGAERGWIFLRHEYDAERKVLEAALESAYAAGALGQNIFGSGFDFELEIFVSPGGYILGEETALIECMEDRRGEPRNKPPFPGTQGLWNQPTLMNNVETFVHATGILCNGTDWWEALGAEGHAGHKFISVSGAVAEPKVVLVPMGSSLRELLDLCGGTRDGAKLLAIAPGGASSNFLAADKRDTAIDFETLADAGSMLGSGAAVFVTESEAGPSMLEVGLNVARFFRNESCGKCVPCRVGSEKGIALLEGQVRVDAESRALLEELHNTLLKTSICGLGQVALAPLCGILRDFSDR